ncbi:efflux RND transporter periplasmic adaptor subunit [Brachyspira alvinipulli]|uniref:efflux RND transporter periplasmic adaptor subunit n=1 Tax=Brachyspira alvinipulli TaxID=84379 RepID=UPI000481A817|nr:efflux RND transporter periplasmic adaptor subunit [Brachyspira alvinipulli]
MMRFERVIILILCLTIFSVSCGKNKADLKKKENPISVLVAAPIKQHLDEYLELSAEIKAIKEVEISSDVPGKIANILKYEGSFVNKGDTIALIDRFVIGANYAYAPARTPISGYVTTTYMAVGASIAASTPIANVADISQLEVEIQVPERSIAGIELGQKVFIRVPSSPNKEIEATITKRDYAVNPSTRTLMVKALIDNKDRLLLPGMFSDVSILLNSADNVFVIPNSSVFSDDVGKNYIYVVKEDNSNNPPAEGKVTESTNMQYRAYTREVNILFTSKDKVALSGGLEEGEEVVMFGREFLKNGSLVNRIENDPTILEYITPPTTLASAQTNTSNDTNSGVNNTNTKPTRPSTATSKPATTVINTNTTKPATTVRNTNTTKPAATVRNTNNTTTRPSTSKENNNTQNGSGDGIYSIGG